MRMDSTEFKQHVARKLFPGQKVVIRSLEKTSMSEEENKDAVVEEVETAPAEESATAEESAPAEVAPAEEEKSGE